MPRLSQKTRFEKAKEMSLAKWRKCAEITEGWFLSFFDDGKLGSELGFDDSNCGFCQYYRNYNVVDDYDIVLCGDCPLCDGGRTCCKEWLAAFSAADYHAYHAAAVALRDRIEKMEYEEEKL